MVIWDQLIAERNGILYIPDYWDADMIRAIRSAYKVTRSASLKSGIGFELTEEELAYLMRRSLGRCEVSGLKFSGDNFTTSKRRPFIPSIDRIKAKEPYDLNNCRLVAWIVNLSLSDWGEDIFWQMIKAAWKRGRNMPDDYVDYEKMRKDLKYHIDSILK